MPLADLLILDIPNTKHSAINFFDIAKMPHYEDVITRFYAWFLDDKYIKDHGAWLRDALFELIMEKSGEKLLVKYCNVQTQVNLITGHRLDLVITVITLTLGKIAIIIENKIYHQLNNDLQSYWDNTGQGCEKKIGVVLSLSKVYIPELSGCKFINILHKEVAVRIGQKAEGISDESNRIYARDFISNLKKLSNMATINKEVKLYFEHAEKINDAIKTRDQAIMYVKSEIKEAAGKMSLNDFPSEDKSEYVYVCDKFEDDLYYVIYFDELLAGKKKIRIVVGISQTARKHLDNFEVVLNNNDISGMIKISEKGKHHANLLAKTYDLSGEDLNDLSGFLAKNITYDFKPMMNLLRIERLKMNQTLN